MANSAFYGRSRQISTLRDAVALIGFGAVRSTVLTTFFMEIFKGSTDRTGFDAEAFWLHSLACAICCRELGKRSHGPASFAEEAFVCGMLHDAGKILLNNHMPEDYKRVMEYVTKQNLTIAEAEREFQHGGLLQFTVYAERAVVIVTVLAAGYFLLLVQQREVLVGKARFLSRLIGQRLYSEFI